MSFLKKNIGNNETPGNNPEALSFFERVKENLWTFLETNAFEKTNKWIEEKTEKANLGLIEQATMWFIEEIPIVGKQIAQWVEKGFKFFNSLKERFLWKIRGVRSSLLTWIGWILGINFEELLEKWKDKVKWTIEKVEWLEKRIDFTRRKEELAKYFKDKNIPIPDWVEKLSGAEVVKELGLSPEDNTWTDYLWEAGFALMIYKFAGAKSLALNAGIYLGLVKKWPESLGGKQLVKYSKELDEWKKRFFDEHPSLEFLLPDFLTGAELQDNVEDFLGWIQENPAESMATVNGMWFFRAYLFSMLKVGLKSGASAIKLVMSNISWKGALVAAVTTYGYMERKQIVDEILDFTYEDWETANKNAIKVNLYDWFGIETSQKTYTEEEKNNSMTTLNQKENFEKACITDSMLQKIGLWEDAKIKTLAYGLLNVTEVTYTEEESVPILTKFKLQEGKDKQIWIDALVDKIYGKENNKKKLEAKLKLYDWALIKEKTTNTLDVETKIIIEELIGDPIKTMNEHWPQILEKFQEGKIAFGIAESTWRVLLFIGKDLNLPIQLAGLTIDQLDILKFAFSEENQNNVIVPVATSIGMTYICGKMSYRWFEAYKYLIKSADEYWEKTLIWLKGLIPGTKEYMYALRSSAWWFPGAESFYATRKAKKIGHSLKYLEEIKQLLENEEIDNKKLEKLCADTKQKLKLIKVGLKDENWMSKHLLDTQYTKNLRTLSAKIDDISNRAREWNLDSARETLTDIEKTLKKYHTHLSSMHEKWIIGLVTKGIINPPSSKKLAKKVTKAWKKTLKSGENLNKMIDVADEAIDGADRLEEIAQRTGKANDIKKAEKAKKLADRLTRAVDASNTAKEKAMVAKQAMQAAHDAQQLAEAGRESLNSTQLARDAEKAYKLARKAANEARNAERAATAAKFNKLREIINKWGKIANFGGKALGVAGVVWNVGFGGYEIYQGLTNENEEQGKIEMTQGWVKVVSGGVEAATLGAVWTIGWLVVANVEIYKYMVDKGLESAAEATMTNKEWAEKETNTLIHDLLSTVDVLNAGDAYRRTFTTATRESIEKEKIDTRQKIIEALIIKEWINNQEITADRMNFLKETSYEFNFNNREEFLKLFNQSRTYAQAMQYAKQEKLDGKNEVILELNQHRKINLLDPKISKIWIAHAFQKIQKAEISPKLSETRFANFEKLDETSILYMLNSIGSYLGSKQNKKTSEIKNLYKELELYAKGVRNIFFQPQIIQDVTKTEIEKLLSFTKNTNFVPEKVEEEMYQIENKPEAFALFEVARIFGYSGRGKIEEIQNFFSEEKKGKHGIYWNEEEWVVNEAGMERDDKMGNNGKTTIQNMIQRIRENQNDILENRNNALVDIFTTYSEEKMGSVALKIAKNLEKGLAKYQNKNQPND